MKRLIGLILFLSSHALAKDLGTFGETFPIQEENLLSHLQAKLSYLQHSGELKRHQLKIIEQVTKSIQRPLPVRGLIKTKAPRSFYFDPSIQVPYDLQDHQEVIFHKAGTRFNPLDFYRLKHPLLFIDGEDKEQVRWAKKQPNDPKIILVNGSPFGLMKEEDKPIYFDQGGSLIKKLGIKQVPAWVKQEERKLFISEISLEEAK